MKKNIKKFMPTVLAFAMLSTNVVFASNVKPIKEEVKNEVQNKNEVIKVELIKEGNNLLFPVRKVFESLGFEVGYDSKSKVVTLTNAPLYVTFSNTEDAYTFSRMAPQKLGQKPVVKEGVTYVPVTLLTDIMQMEDVNIDGNTLTIGKKEEDTNIVKEKKQTLITEINKEENTVTVEDPEKGTVVLNIKGLKVEYTTIDKELMVGQAVEVVYGDAMTRSLPPMNTPKSLKVVDKISYGEVLSVEKDGENVVVLYKDSKLGEVSLNISSSTKVEYLGDVKEFKKGQKLEVVLGDAMTMSLPPINNPKSVKVLENSNKVEEDNESMELANATVVSFDKGNNQVLIKDDKMGEVLLNITKDVVIEFKNKEDKNWAKEGTKIKVEYSPIMTRSLPPINNPVKIVVL